MNHNPSLLLVSLLCAGSAMAALQAENFVVRAQNSSFSPATLEIEVGDSVTWVNAFDNFHTITSSSAIPAWGEETLTEEDEQVTLQFKSAGSFSYYCRFHSGMTGLIIVSKPASENTPPAVQLTAPDEGQVFAIGAAIQVDASASDADGIAQVEFFTGNSSIGFDFDEPYGILVTNLAGGIHSLVAVAVDARGANTTSNPISIVVVEPAPIVLSAATFVGGQFRFQFSATPGLSYVIEASETTEAITPMITIGVRTATADLETFTDSDIRSNRTYRVRRQ